MHSDQQTVAWWPGHADIPGDGRADTLARGAIYLASTLQPTSSYSFRRVWDAIITSWQRQVDRSKPAITVVPSYKPFPPSRRQTRSIWLSHPMQNRPCISWQVLSHIHPYRIYELLVWTPADTRTSNTNMAPSTRDTETYSVISPLTDFLKKSGAFTENRHSSLSRHKPTIGASETEDLKE